MSVPEQGLRRVSIQAGDTVVDVALPSQMPVATLIPPIVDIVEGRTAERSAGRTATRYQLCRPGTASLRAAMTLAQNGVRDGDTLVLSHSPEPVPAPRYDDVAEAISSALLARGWDRPHERRAARLVGAVAAGLLAGVGGLALIRNSASLNNVDTTAGVAGLAAALALIVAAFAHRACRDPLLGNALGVIATIFAAVAGFLAVPGIPGLSNVLLAAMAAAVVSTLIMRVSHGGAVTFTAISCFDGVLAIAALAGVITAAPVRAISSVTTLASLGLLSAAARLSIIMAGLSPRLPTPPDAEACEPCPAGLPDRARRADTWLRCLLAAFSSSAAVGAIITALGGAPRPNCFAFALLTGVLLLLGAQPLQARTLICAIAGLLTVATTLGCLAVSVPRQGPWIAAGTACLVAFACILGFVTPTPPASAIARRSIDLFECVALVAMVPLTCWVCGVYGVARGVYLPWS